MFKDLKNFFSKKETPEAIEKQDKKQIFWFLN